MTNEHLLKREPGLSAFISRRTLVSRSVTIGAAFAALPLLAACGDDEEDPEPESTEPPVGASEDPTATTAAEEEEEPEATEPAEEEDAEATEPVEEEEEPEATEPAEEEGEETPEAPAAEGEGLYGGTIRVGLYEEPATLDPHTTTSPPAHLIREHICETLIALGADLGPIPLLADSWEISDDGLTYTLPLREDAIFHNGEPLRPTDVQFSFERILEISPRSADYAEIESINEVDEHTIEFQLLEFSAPFVAKLTQNFTHIVPREASQQDIDENGAITHPIGTGPYEFVSYTHGQEAVVRRFEDFVPRAEPSNGKGGAKYAYIDEITFVPMIDETVRLLALENGEIDHMQQFPPAEFERVQSEGNLTTAVQPGTDWGAMYFNFTKPPFDDLRMRQAVAQGIDWQALANAVFWGYGVANHSFIPHSDQFWRTPVHDELHQYNPDRARELVEEYGYGGETLEWWARDNYRDRTTAQVIQQMFSEIGLNFEIRTMESAAFLDGIYVRRQGLEPEWPLVTTTASSYRPDPDQHYYQRVHSESHAGMYNNPDYDAIVEEARSIADPDQRRDLYEQAQQIVMEEVPCIITFNAPYLDAYRPRLQNMNSTDPLAPFYWNVWIEE